MKNRIILFLAVSLLFFGLAACAFKLDAEKFSASGHAAEAKAKQRPSVLSVRADPMIKHPVYS